MSGVEKTNTRHPHPLLIVWAIVSLTALLWTMMGMRIQQPVSISAREENFHQLWPMCLAAAGTWAALTAVAVGLWRNRQRHSPPRKWGGSGFLIILVALAARVAVLIVHQPTLSDDIYRYIFDGNNLIAGINPYLPVPEQRLSEPEAWPGEAELLPLINNPELSTIYLPVSQLAFGGSALVSQVLQTDQTSVKTSTVLFRGVFVGFDLAVIFLLLTVLNRTGRSPWWAALYAWHPLPLIEIAGSGHQEPIGIALLVAALVIWTIRPRATAQWTVPLTLAASVKPVAAPLAVFFLRDQPLKTWLLTFLLATALGLLVAGPLLLTHGGEPLQNLTSTAQRFSLKWAHFGSIYEPLLWFVEQISPADATTGWTNDDQEIIARTGCLAIVAAMFVAIWKTKLPTWIAVEALLLMMLLLSTTAHPWYLLWALALLPMAFSASVWAASLTLLLGYTAWTNPDWQVSPWLMVAAYVPVYAGLIWDTVVLRKCVRERSM